MKSSPQHKTICSDLPEFCGIYFLWNDEDLIYIGSSQCIKRRVSQHPMKGKFNRVTTIQCSPEILLAEERKQIIANRPKFTVIPLCADSRKHSGQNVIVDFSVYRKLRKHTDNMGMTIKGFVSRAILNQIEMEKSTKGK